MLLSVCTKENSSCEGSKLLNVFSLHLVFKIYFFTLVETGHLAQAGLELVGFLTQPAGIRGVSPCLVHELLSLSKSTSF